MGDLLAKSQPFLFGPDLTSADAFFFNVLFRCSNASVEDFENVLQRSKHVRAYWAAVQAREEARVVTDYTKLWAFKNMAKMGVPFKLLGLMLGILRVPELPKEVEEGIEAAYAARVREYYGNSAAPETDPQPKRSSALLGVRETTCFCIPSFSRTTAP